MKERNITGKKQTPADLEAQALLRARGDLPSHIAIIMDGNGRWAREHGLSRVAGHRHGVKSVRDVTEACAQLEVDYLTLYTFSTENWQRPLQEVNALMELLIATLRKETQTLMENNIRLASIGDVELLPPKCRLMLEESIQMTEGNSHMTLNLALSYSGRWDIVTAARQIASAVQSGHLQPDAIDETRFTTYLTTAGMPDPDLLIRTGGDFRVSNFLLWQIAYTEIYIADPFWPDFRREHLYAAIRDYQDRERRFGRVLS